MSIGIKEAFNIALFELHVLYSETLSLDVLLEETGFDETNNNWLITLGFDLDNKRHYRQFKIDAQDGLFLGMKNRTF